MLNDLLSIYEEVRSPSNSDVIEGKYNVVQGYKLHHTTWFCVGIELTGLHNPIDVAAMLTEQDRTNEDPNPRLP